MKYINADKLIAEVERRKEKWLAESRLIRKGKDKAMYAAGKSSGYTEFLSLIDSLQQEQPQVADASKMEQPEVDLERETVLNYVHEHYYYDKDFDGYGHGKFRPIFTCDDLIGFARHFYELGLNARKEE